MVALLRAGVALAEGEPDLGDPQPRIADQDLEQDLEAARSQLVHRDRVPAHEEEAAHRVGHPAQPLREQQPGHGRARARGHGARPAKAVPLAALAVAARDHEVELALLGLLEQRGDQLGWMLEVGVHDADPRSASRAQALHDGSAQAADAAVGRLGQQHDLSPAAVGGRLDDLGGAVGAGVHEDDLHRDRGQHGLEALDQRLDVAALVLGRHDDREEGLLTEDPPRHGPRRCAQGFAYRRGRVRRQGRSSVPEKS